MRTCCLRGCLHLSLSMGCLPSLSSNLYQPQKLMSIDLDPPALLPVNKRDNPLNLPINGIQDKPGFPDSQLSSSGGSIVSDHPTFLSMLAFLSTGLVVLFLINQYYRRRSRPKRKRPRQAAKPRRTQPMGAFGLKIPGV